jgi:hypothetical protein
MDNRIVGGTYDAARLVALWVSAFEILANPDTQKVSRGLVKRMLAPAQP